MFIVVRTSPPPMKKKKTPGEATELLACGTTETEWCINLYRVPYASMVYFIAIIAD